MKIYGAHLHQDSADGHFTVKMSEPTVATGLQPSSPTTDVYGSNQATQPSIPLQKTNTRASLGDSGTRMMHGIIMDDYNPQLQGVQALRIYEEMRKSDGTVRALLISLKLPIRRAKWFINPASDSPQDKKVAEFLEHALFDWLEGMTWDDFISQSLLHLDFGVMLFEKIYTIKTHEGTEYVTLQKLAPRLPKSILKWELDDGTLGIQQIRQDGILAQIPASKMVVLINEREGDNWWGISVLRAPYKHFYYKNNYYKIDAIAFERQTIGVPMMEMPAGYTDADERRASTVLQNLRANESSYAVVPTGYKLSFLDMGAHTTKDPEKAIEHHDKLILLSGLTQFLNLGSSGSTGGSRALSTDHSDLFLKGEEAVANNITDAINKQLIPELVDLNFDGITVYPILDYSGIRKEDVAALGTAYSMLVTAGGLTPTDDDQQYLRGAMGLPPRTQEDIDAESEDDPSSEEMRDEADIEDDPSSQAPASPSGTQPQETETGEAPNAAPAKTTTPEAAADAPVEAAPKKVAVPPSTKAKQKTAKPPAEGKPTKTEQEPAAPATNIQKKKAHDHKLPRTFDDGKGFMSWRPLTFAEKKVRWSDIQDKMNALESGFTDKAKKLLNDEKDEFMSAAHDAIAKGDNKALSALELNFVAEYKSLLKSTMKDAYEFGKTKASKEMGVNVPANDADTIASFDLMADTVANKTAATLEAQAKLSAMNAIKNETNPLQAAGQIDSDLEDAISQTVDNTAGVIVGQSLNNGRSDAFDENSDNIYALQRSEILDDKTCNFCLSIDGSVVALDDDMASADIFHDWCRGIWVEILNDEQDPPPIDGVAPEVASLYGGSVNDLKQPRDPIVKPGSPAAKAVEKKDSDVRLK